MPASLPTRRRLTTLFVDIAGSTSLLVHHPPEVVLSVVQGFMTLATEVASSHAGTVKDFEGDGALVDFASVKNAVRAEQRWQTRCRGVRRRMVCGSSRNAAWE
jgi:class 3 adenylate cyclase